MVTVESGKSGKGFKYTAPFGSSRENVKERISLMMKTRKLKAGIADPGNNFQPEALLDPLHLHPQTDCSSLPHFP